MGPRKDSEKMEKIFPDYFKRFELPEGAAEELIQVYRACRSGKCDRESFLPSFEEKGCNESLLSDPTDHHMWTGGYIKMPPPIKNSK